MSYKDFVAQKVISQMKLSDAGFRLELVEPVDSDSIQSITYYFNKAGDQPLYELIVRHKPNVNLHQTMLITYGRPNCGKEWCLRDQLGRLFRIWRYGQNLVVAASLTGTEWEEDSRQKEIFLPNQTVVKFGTWGLVRLRPTN